MKFTMIERSPVDFGVGMDLYPTEIHTVSAIDEIGPASLTELAERAGVTKGAASQLVAKLVRKGLLKKSPDPEHGSKVVIEVTELGKKASDHHYEYHFAHDREFLDYLGSMPETEWEIFKDICRHMDKWMDNYLK